MRVSYSWLASYIPNLPTPSEVADTLTSIGLEVEKILSFDYLRDFSVARILEANKHPNADSLSLCMVDTGSETLQIVCGAPNVRPGMFVVLAPIGTVMPSGLKIKKSKIRGEFSHGMMCSRDELQLSTRASRGIMEVDEHPLGTNAQDALGMNDVAFEVALTPNRSDCFSVQGIARDLATKLRLPLNLNQEAPTNPAQFPSDISVNCNTSACPHFLARVIRNVKNGPSPAWLQKRIREAGGSPISALVDITNFFLFDACRPLHVFDVRAFKNGAINIRLSDDGENFVGLDEHEYTLPAGSIVITDSDNKIASLAGIMGAKHSGSYEDTTDVILECALFDPAVISRTGQKTKILTEARTRFERGVDAIRAHALFEQATSMILQICGGDAGTIVEHKTQLPTPPTLAFSAEDYHTFMGFSAPANYTDVLKDLGYTEVNNNQWTAPSWRHDVKLPQDAFFDIWRMSSQSTENLTPLTTTKWPQPSLLQKATSSVRCACIAQGYHETTPLMMVSQQVHSDFSGKQEPPHITNPISQDLSFLRPNLISSLLLSAKQNIDYKVYPLQLFEIGPVYSDITPQSRETHLCGLIAGPFHAHSWQNPTSSASPLDSKRHVSAILKSLHIDPTNITIKQNNPPSYCHPTQSGHIFYGDTLLGIIGTLHPNIVSSLMKTREPICFFEINLGPLLSLCDNAIQNWSSPVISQWHDIHRDLAFVASQTTPLQELIDEIKSSAGEHLASLSVFDYFTGEGLPENTVSIGFHLVYNSQHAQLAEDVVSSSMNKIIKNLTAKFPVQLRQ